MNFFWELRTWFYWLVTVCAHAAVDIYNSPLLPDFLGDFVYEIGDAFYVIGRFFEDAAYWYEHVEDELKFILSWSNIQDNIRGWLSGIESLIVWFADWRTFVQARIDLWWSGVMAEVQGWIDAAVQGIDQLVAGWNDFVNDTLPELWSRIYQLQGNWTEFWTVTLPGLVDFSGLASWWTSTINQVQQLIDSAFTVRESLWAGWQETRDQVLEFFTDPWGWLYNRFDDFIERYW